MNLPSAKKGSVLQSIEFFVLLTAFFCLIIFSKSSAELIISALRLCVYRVIPALFPFAVLSSMLICLPVPSFISRAFSRWFNLSASGSSVFISGLLSGFPIAAINTSKLYGEGKIGKNEAERLLCFTNNASAPFCICVVGVGILKSFKMGVLIYFIITLSSILTAFALKGGGKTEDMPFVLPSVTFGKAVKEGVLSMLTVVGHITLFTLINSALGKVLENIVKNGAVIALVSAFTELSGGIFALSRQISCQNTLFVLCTLASAFSGICVHMQIRGAVKGQGLSMKKFVIAKLVQSLFSALCACISVVLFF